MDLCKKAAVTAAGHEEETNAEEKKLISVIVPCYNEQECLPMFYKEITKVTGGMQEAHPELDFEYLFIDDGSKDRTLRTLRIMARYDKRVRYISFSRNFGKEAGIYAGLKNAKGDYCVVMDADLQHPPAFLPKMYEAVASGQYDCATTRRVSREGESKVRSWFARLFYKIMNAISQTEIVDGAQDFRFMTRQMVDAVLSMSEYNRFSKGIFSWVGFRVKYLEYENVERAAGTTAWSFWSLFRYSLEGIIGFSTAPLSISAVVGFISCLLGLIMLIVTVIKKLAVGEPVAGYPTMICTILFFGGLQLFCTGILGLYLGKTYLEVKRRPIYLARETEADAEKMNDLPESDAVLADAAESTALPEPDAARTAIALEKAQQLKQEADDEFDALIGAAAEEAEEDEPDETNEEVLPENEEIEEAAEEETADAEETAEAEDDFPDEDEDIFAAAVAEADTDDENEANDEPAARSVSDAPAVKPKKEKFEVKIDYDSIDFDEDFDDEDDAEEPDDYDDEYDPEYDDDDDYDAEYDDDEDYDDDDDYDDYDEDEEGEEDEEDDDSDSPSVGARAAEIWARVKAWFASLGKKIGGAAAGLRSDSDQEDEAEYDEDSDADDDDYDDSDDDDFDDFEDDDFDDDDEDDSSYRGAHF